MTTRQHCCFLYFKSSTDHRQQRTRPCPRPPGAKHQSEAADWACGLVWFKWRSNIVVKITSVQVHVVFTLLCRCFTSAQLFKLCYWLITAGTWSTTRYSVLQRCLNTQNTRSESGSRLWAARTVHWITELMFPDTFVASNYCQSLTSGFITFNGGQLLYLLLLQ